MKNITFIGHFLVIYVVEELTTNSLGIEGCFSAFSLCLTIVTAITQEVCYWNYRFWVGFYCYYDYF